MTICRTRKLTQSERAPLGACHYDLDLWPFDPKIYRRLTFFILHLCMKYEVCRSNTVRVIALQRSVDRRTDRQTDKVITIGLPHLRWRGPNKVYYMAIELRTNPDTISLKLQKKPVLFPLLGNRKLTNQMKGYGIKSKFCCTNITTWPLVNSHQWFLTNDLNV